ncbi:hypothetical protein FACS1894185_2590 [Betaproteobacteria bacterium]|nr:hypothetical protein FACS1894185_2590 [Betaproteobacteria bacterium]
MGKPQEEPDIERFNEAQRFFVGQASFGSDGEDAIAPGKFRRSGTFHVPDIRGGKASEGTDT